MNLPGPERPPDNPRRPIDPDVELPVDSADRQARPAPTLTGVVLVATGGAVGTGLRFGLSALVPPLAEIPVITLAINVVGAFLLGWLLELLAGEVPTAAWDRRLRLGLGTGALGGFTTYSALAADTGMLLAVRPGWAVGYGVGTVVLGGVGSVLGIWLGRRRSRRGEPT